MTLHIEKIAPAEADTLMLTKLWIEGIRQKDPAYYEYVRAHGRDTARHQQDEAEVMDRTFRQHGDSYCLFLARQNNKSVGFLLACDEGKATRVSRLCSLGVKQGIGTKLVETLMANLNPQSKSVTAVAHEGSIGFWEKMGLKPTGKLHEDFGTNVVSMKLDEEGVAHWRQKKAPPIAPPMRGLPV